jgi:hypothetical protein
MAAPKGKNDLERIFSEVIELISIKGKSLKDALKEKMSSQTFYELLADEAKSKRYARACEERADLIADEVFEIADNKTLDENGMIVKDDNIKVQRDRLRVDSRKWLLAKLHPKKYGDKIDVEHSGGITLHFDKDDSKV